MDEVDDMLMEELMAVNPGCGWDQSLRQIDDAYIRLIPLARAGATAEGGQFTPKQLGTAIRRRHIQE